MASWAKTWASVVGRNFRAQQYPFEDEGFVGSEAPSSIRTPFPDVTSARKGEKNLGFRRLHLLAHHLQGRGAAEGKILAVRLLSLALPAIVASPLPTPHVT